MINRSPATAKKPEFPKEDREGTFSSLPLTFFSPSVPQSTIDLFTSNGGLTLPTLDPMELQYYFKSPFTENHPFYHVDLIFVTGPDDLLGTVLRERVLIYYEHRWVEKCIEKGEMLDMVRYIVDFLIKTEMEGGEEDDELNVEGDQVNRPPTNDIPDRPTSQLSNPPLSDPLPSRTALPKTDNLLKYAVRTVPPSAFTSESALRKASFNPNSASRFRASTAPFTRPRFPTPTNAIAGPSKLKDELESQEPEQTFNPIDYSSQRVSSEESAIPVLQIPHRKLDEIKFREFETWIKECKVHDLEDFYPELMECGKDDKIIRGLEAGLLG
jgi:hypothetical protein